MEFIEGAIHEIRRWTDGKGANVVLHDDGEEYFYYGDIGIERFIGRSGRFEIKDGEGPMKGKHEIISFDELKTNPEIPKPELPKEIKQQQAQLAQQKAKSFVQIPFDQFQAVMNNRSALDQSKTRALQAAVEVYKAMSKVERDPKAAALDVVVISKMLEGYLL